MFQSAKELSLVHDRMNTFLANDFCFKHFFHGIKFLWFFKLNTPNLTKAAFSYNIQVIKVKSVDLFRFDNDFVLFFLFLN